MPKTQAQQGGEMTNAPCPCHHAETETCLQHLIWETQETRTREEGALQMHRHHGDTCNPAQNGTNTLIEIASIHPDC